MSSNSKPTSKKEAFEMIELAIDELDLLTRAFSVIKEACGVSEDASENASEEVTQINLH